MLQNLQLAGDAAHHLRRLLALVDVLDAVVEDSRPVSPLVRKVNRWPLDYHLFFARFTLVVLARILIHDFVVAHGHLVVDGPDVAQLAKVRVRGAILDAPNG